MHRITSLAFVVLAIGTANFLRAAEPTIRLPIYFIEESPVGNHPTSVVLTSNDWHERAIATLGDAIGQAPGLILQESFGGFEPPRLSIRGSGVQSAPSSRGLALTLDDLPLGLADGSFNSTFLVPFFADKIEVSRGLDGWWAAPTTMGGVLDLVSSHDPTPTLRTEAGSLGAFRVNARGGAKLAPDALFSADADYERQDGYRPQSAQQRSAFFANAQKATSANGEIVASLFYVRPVYEVPGPLTLSAAENSPRTVSSDVARDQPKREAELWRAAIDASGQVSTFRYNSGLAWQHTTDWFRQLQANGLSDSKSDDLSLLEGLSRQVDIAGSQHRLRLEATAARGWRDAQRWLNNSGQAGALFGHDGLYATTATLKAEDAAQISPNFLATFGGSSIYGRREIVDRIPVATSPVRTNLSLSQSANLAALGLQWSAAPEQVLFAGFTQTAEPPTFDDLLVVGGTYPNLSRRSQPLQGQRASTFELGTRGRLGPVEWSFTAYRSEWRNEILRLADASGQPRGAVNAGPTLHAGLESSLRWKIYDQGQRLTLSAQNVWSRFNFDGDPIFGYNRLAGVPPCVGSAELSYERPNGFFASSGLNWAAGKTSADHAGRLSYGGHSIANLRAGWRHTETWTIYIEIQNVLDRPYIASTAGVLDIARNPAATAVFLPGNGRTFNVGFEWRK